LPQDNACRTTWLGGKKSFLELLVRLKLTPEEFRAFVKDQMERWGKVVREANIKLG